MRHIKKIFLSIISGILGMLCAAAVSGICRADTAAARLSHTHDGVTHIEKKIHELVNREREKRGLPALLWDDGLHRIARKYSEDMAERNFFSHEDPEGRGFSDRYRAALFECRIRVGDAICMGGENIAQLQLGNSSIFKNGELLFDRETEDKIAQWVVKGWMDSRNHRENILTPYFKQQGIGIAVSDDGKVYITEDFC